MGGLADSGITVAEIIAKMPGWLGHLWSEYSEDKKLSPGEIVELLCHIAGELADLANEETQPKIEAVETVI